jgi:hypothetical protein
VEDNALFELHPVVARVAKLSRNDLPRCRVCFQPWPLSGRGFSLSQPDLEQAVSRVNRAACLLNLCFFELDVLARDGIIFLKNELFSRRARIFLRDVEESSSGRRQQLNLLSNGLSHGSRLVEKLRRNASATERATYA